MQMSFNEDAFLNDMDDQQEINVNEDSRMFNLN